LACAHARRGGPLQHRLLLRGGTGGCRDVFCAAREVGRTGRGTCLGGKGGRPSKGRLSSEGERGSVAVGTGISYPKMKAYRPSRRGRLKRERKKTGKVFLLQRAKGSRPLGHCREGKGGACERGITLKRGVFGKVGATANSAGTKAEGQVVQLHGSGSSGNPKQRDTL